MFALKGFKIFVSDPIKDNQLVSNHDNLIIPLQGSHGTGHNQHLSSIISPNFHQQRLAEIRSETEYYRQQLELERVRQVIFLILIFK